jgi:GNAT superfamily N-acetyltransferase
MEAIHLISHEEVLKRFKSVYAAEGLSCKDIKNTLWFASENSCAALVLVSAKKVRIKATVTRPEYRGLGYGNAMLLHLINAKESEGLIIESFAKNPKWYLKNGFTVDRVTKWGVCVVQRTN